ncbi:hypothetical protein [Pontimicrobium aquaticum]|uniref:Uncharacterized protein n=1 Tax=Pontimicrobium aquaticum TaxID=2565367 RepID=A0A4U0EJL3_9FLAO|nr:hypothetical protein [Pontimicrobium aquaticum]TJY31581.1 hypothetical protein E5167_15155 [Pontimicrobium aquaticum]
MTSEEKIKTIQIIKNRINSDKNGYCSVYWAIRQVKKEYMPKDFEIKTISSIITENGKYIKEPNHSKSHIDFDITLNPESNWFKRNPVKTELLRIFIAIFIAIITSIITTEIKIKNKQSDKTQQSTKQNTPILESTNDPITEQDSSKTQRPI